MVVAVEGKDHNSLSMSIFQNKTFFSDDDEEEDTNLYRDIINLLHYYIRRLYYRTRKFRRVG